MIDKLANRCKERIEFCISFLAKMNPEYYVGSELTFYEHKQEFESSLSHWNVMLSYINQTIKPDKNIGIYFENTFGKMLSYNRNIWLSLNGISSDCGDEFLGTFLECQEEYNLGKKLFSDYVN